MHRDDTGAAYTIDPYERSPLDYIGTANGLGHSHLTAGASARHIGDDRMRRKAGSRRADGTDGVGLWIDGR